MNSLRMATQAALDIKQDFMMVTEACSQGSSMTQAGDDEQACSIRLRHSNSSEQKRLQCRDCTSRVAVPIYGGLLWDW